MRLLLGNQFHFCIEHDTDFYSVIVFDEPTSKQLISTGIHLGRKRIESLLYFKSGLSDGEKVDKPASVASSAAALFTKRRKKCISVSVRLSDAYVLLNLIAYMDLSRGMC